jgi:hypothetical protein
MTFPFEDLYQYFVRPLIGRPLKAPCCDPVLMKLKTKNGRPVTAALAPAIMVLSYLAKPNGNAELLQLIEKSIEEEDDSFCMILAHEGHLKLFIGGELSDYEPMIDKRLTNDPTADHVLMVRIFHRTGVYSGFLPIDKNRAVQYVPAMGLRRVVMNVKPDGDKNLH